MNEAPPPNGKVIDFEAAREERKPHISGSCRCLSCKHEWVQVMPYSSDGTTWLECPSCLRNLGRYVEHFIPGDRHPSFWACLCGNELFKLYRGTEYAWCPSCGARKPLAEIISGA